MKSRKVGKHEKSAKVRKVWKVQNSEIGKSEKSEKSESIPTDFGLNTKKSPEKSEKF